jgi:hypothetical protein
MGTVRTHGTTGVRDAPYRSLGRGSRQLETDGVSLHQVADSTDLESRLEGHDE